jgi:ketosteroid isomerase-like protein
VSEVDDFLAAVLPRQHAAETAILNGDAGPRSAFWSEREPVTIWGAGRNSKNRRETDEVFDSLKKLFSDGQAELEVIAAEASSDLGYIVGYEHNTASVDGAQRAAIDLRVTLVFRREDGEWRAVHRHADPRAQGQPAVERARELLNQ